MVIAAVMVTGVRADSAPKILKIQSSELNDIITRKDSNCLLAFMAAWCRPCKEELPILNRLYHQFQGKGIRFVGISIDVGGPKALERVLKKNRVDFPVFWVGESAVDEYKIVGIPMIFLIKNGEIVEKIPGKCSHDFLRGRILELSQ